VPEDAPQAFHDFRRGLRCSVDEGFDVVDDLVAQKTAALFPFHAVPTATALDGAPTPVELTQIDQ
jgi:hypothetical protein